jgi:hypothetical protein
VAIVDGLARIPVGSARTRTLVVFSDPAPKRRSLFLDHAQQLSLGADGHPRHFVEQERAFLSQLGSSPDCARWPGEAPFS